jgi:hypothetical protein
MVVCIQLAVFLILLIVAQVPAQNYYKPSITCYTKYDHEQTKSQASNSILSYSYSQAETTQYTTAENELCSNVGCACFSYRTACSSSSMGPHHFAHCTDADRLNGVLKWHRGLTSHAKCDQLRHQPQTYLDLSCCYTDRCNDQQGQITKIVDIQYPAQRHDSHVHPTASHMHFSNKPSQHHDGSIHRTTSYMSVTDKPNQSYDKPLSANNSLSSISFSNWLMFFPLVFCLIVLKQQY